MYIPTFVIMIIIGIIGFYTHFKKEEENQKHREEMEDLRQKSIEERRKQYEEKEALKELGEKQLIRATFNCSEDKAEKIHLTLKKAIMLSDFNDAANNAERKRVYDEAVEEEKDIDAFHDYAINTLLPVIKENDYSLKLETIESFRKDFYCRPDISPDEKLKQIHMNLKNGEKTTYITLRNLVLQSDESPNTYSDGDTIHYFEHSELIQIAKKYNIFFDIGLTEDTLNSIDFDYFGNEYDSTKIQKNARGLFNIFCACIYYSEVLEVSLKDILNKRDFMGVLFDLFVLIPYYDIKEYSSVIKQEFNNTLLDRYPSYKYQTYFKKTTYKSNN